MRLAFGLVLLCTSAALHAAMPVYNTDVLAQGETSASLGVSYTKQEADIRFVMSGVPYTGTAEATTQTDALMLAYGINDRLTGYVSGALSDYESKLTLTSPAMVDMEYNQSGFEDLGLELEYLLDDNKTTPVVARAQVLVPTASDYPGVTGLTANGSQLSAAEDGGRGKGYTRMSFQLAGSAKGERNVLEWELRLSTDDEKDTEDIYGVSLGWVHHFRPALFLRLTGNAIFRQEESNAAGSTSDIRAYGVALSAVYLPSPTLRLSVGYSYQWADDLHIAYSNGNTLDQSNPITQGAGITLAFLFP